MAVSPGGACAASFWSTCSIRRCSNTSNFCLAKWELVPWPSLKTTSCPENSPSGTVEGAQCFQGSAESQGSMPALATGVEVAGWICILYKKQIGTHREKKHVLTLTLMLVRRKSAGKTSAGSSKIFRWLAPLLGPNLDPKTGPKQRPKRRNENVIQFWTPF